MFLRQQMKKDVRLKGYKRAQCSKYRMSRRRFRFFGVQNNSTNTISPESVN